MVFQLSSSTCTIETNLTSIGRPTRQARELAGWNIQTFSLWNTQLFSLWTLIFSQDVDEVLLPHLLASLDIPVQCDELRSMLYCRPDIFDYKQTDCPTLCRFLWDWLKSVRCWKSLYVTLWRYAYEQTLASKEISLLF